MPQDPHALAKLACERHPFLPETVVTMLRMMVDDAPRTGCAVGLDSHGFMRGLRLLRGDAWCFSGCPARSGWVLWYVRKPELRRGRIDLSRVRAHLPGAVATPSGEIKVRLHSPADMNAMLDLAAEAR